jgi:hypothetical protein
LLLLQTIKRIYFDAYYFVGNLGQIVLQSQTAENFLTDRPEPCRAPRKENHTMNDETESIRRAMLVTGQPHKHLAETEASKGQTWTTDQLAQDFEVIGFSAPFVVVTRKSDGVKGSLEFTHSPRVYFNFVEYVK